MLSSRNKRKAIELGLSIDRNNKSHLFKELAGKGKNIDKVIEEELVNWRPTYKFEAFVLSYWTWPKLSIFDKALEFLNCMTAEHELELQEYLQLRGFTLSFFRSKLSICDQKSLIKVRFHKVLEMDLHKGRYSAKKRETMLAGFQKTLIRILKFVNASYMDAREVSINQAEPEWVSVEVMENSTTQWVELFLCTIISFEHVFKIQATEGEGCLIEFCSKVLGEVYTYTGTWRILDNLLRVYSSDESIEKYGEVVEELRKNPEKMEGQLAIMQRSQQQELYRDALVEKINTAFNRKKNCFWNGAINTKDILIVRWHVFCQRYVQPDANGLVWFLGHGAKQFELEAQRYRHMNLADKYPDEVSKTYSIKSFSSKNLKNKKGTRKGGCENQYLGFSGVDLNEEESELPVDVPVQNTLELNPHEKKDTLVSKTVAQMVKPNKMDDKKNSCKTSKKIAHQAPSKAASTRNDNKSGRRPQLVQCKVAKSTGNNPILTIEDGGMSKFVELSVKDFFYHEDFHLFVHRVAPRAVEEKNMAIFHTRGTTWIPKAVSQVHSNFGIIRGSHGLFQEYMQNASVDWLLLIQFLIDVGAPSKNRDSKSHLTYRLDLGTADHNFHVREGFFRHIPRWYCGLDKIENYNKNLPVKESLKELLDAMQLLLDQAFLDHIGSMPPMQDSFLYETFAKPFAESLGCKHLRFPCVNLGVTEIRDDEDSVTVTEHADTLNGKRKGNNYTVTASFFFDTCDEQKKRKLLRLCVILYTRRQCEDFEDNEGKLADFKEKLQFFKRSILDSYQNIWPDVRNMNPSDNIFLDDGLPWQNVGIGNEKSLEVLTTEASWEKNIWCSAGITILRKLYQRINDDNIMSQLLVLAVYQTSWARFYFIGTELLRMKDLPSNLALYFAKEMITVFGSCTGGPRSRSKTPAVDWIKYYSNDINLNHASHAIIEFLKKLDSTPRMTLHCFQEEVKCLSNSMKGVGEFALQLVALYGALSGFILTNHIENATLSYPVRNAGSRKALLKNGFEMKDYEKVARLCCEYMSLPNRRLDWGEFILGECFRGDWNKLDSIFRYQSLFRIHINHEHWVVQEKKFGSKQWTKLGSPDH